MSRRGEQRSGKWVRLATATGTPDSSGSNLRLAHICRMNAAFRLGARCKFGGGNEMRPRQVRQEFYPFTKTSMSSFFKKPLRLSVAG